MRYLPQQSDCVDWHLAEYKQLNAHKAQYVFAQQIPRLPHCNVLAILWTYVVRNNDVEKARCVCNVKKVQLL